MWEKMYAMVLDEGKSNIYIMQFVLKLFIALEICITVINTTFRSFDQIRLEKLGGHDEKGLSMRRSIKHVLEKAYPSRH